MSPSRMPKLSWITFANGASPLVVQEALEITFWSGVNSRWLTPTTYIGASLEGAEITTLLTPLCKWTEAVSRVVNFPVLSTMYSAPPDLCHANFDGSLSLSK
ncbi:hypothetical protein AWJ20_3420 [Sugiyamaella lignohabitans]|uniref:Uncharacterized protein n=1 Tax=Sugiyamaella lignohabitans TaxID=796027 RepID=A0A167FW63_9ASCO|nr:uncharacterized protein AWJ20_3420 [Sugiyamaella lignohabitans]ANB15776.1 hypothetical protein AWJ20_3420 [Sugiyamaella lignohabitans]